MSNTKGAPVETVNLITAAVPILAGGITWLVGRRSRKRNVARREQNEADGVIADQRRELIEWRGYGYRVGLIAAETGIDQRPDFPRPPSGPRLAADPPGTPPELSRDSHSGTLAD